MCRIAPHNRIVDVVVDGVLGLVDDVVELVDVILLVVWLFMMRLVSCGFGGCGEQSATLSCI